MKVCGSARRGDGWSGNEGVGLKLSKMTTSIELSLPNSEIFPCFICLCGPPKAWNCEISD